jgi:hypothetical protein
LKISLVSLSTLFKSKYKLEWLYKSLFLRYFSSEFQKLPKYSFDSILIRGMLKVMEKTRLNLLDNHKFFNPQECDLLHSPHYALPPEELTGNLPRLLTIYDLIPIKATEFVPPSLTNYFQKIINSVNIQKDWVTCISRIYSSRIL